MPLPDTRDAITGSAPSRRKQSLLASAQLLADLEHPWLGLESFREETRAYFFGRDAEIAELHLRLRSDRLLVLYGRSGLGKTSILSAGLIPRLRAEKGIPLLLRLWYEELAQEVSSQLVSAVFGGEDTQSRSLPLKSKPTNSLVWTQRLSERLGLSSGLSLPDDPASRLWLRLHYRDEPPDITHLILDQFEEIFTLGARQPGAEENVRDILAILLQGAVPKPIGRLISEHDSFGDHFDPDSLPVRVILALRSDYVYADAALQKETQARREADLATRRARWLAVGAVLVALVAVAAFTAALVAWGAAQAAKERAVASKKAADGLIRFMQHDLHDTLGKLGHLELMRTISTQVMKYYENYPPEVGDVGALRERAMALMEQGNLFLAQNNLDSALKSYRDGLAIWERLAKPTDADSQRDLCNSYERVGDVQRAQGDFDGVLKSYRESLAIREKLAKQDPNNAGWQRDLSNSYERIGDVQKIQGDSAIALKSYSDSLTIRERLTNQDPNDAYLQHDISNSYERIGDVQKALVDFAGALKSYRDSLTMRERLTNQDPTNADWQRDLSNSYERIGDVQIAQEDFAGELNSYRDSLAKRDKLAKQDSTNTDWQHDLSLSYERIGNVQKAQGDFAGALKSYRDSLAKREKLTKRDSTNADWQRDLSLSYERVGDLQSVQGDLASALKSYRDSLAIREKLAIQDPNNNIRKVDIAFSCWRAGTTLARSDPQSKKEAHSLVERARDTLGKVKEKTGLTPQQQAWLDSIEADLNKI